MPPVIPLGREALEDREARDLAPFAARSRDSRGRARPEPDHPYRPRFARDRDRIVHSTAFRRLESKTQVFIIDEGDHYRTRLTHTLEVAQVGRTAARALGLNEDLVEAVALAHDLGHAPFGHAGSEALEECLRGHGGFEHNRQSLRVVDLLERRDPRYRGLNLTFEVRESILKKKPAPAGGTPLPQDFDPRAAPLLEAQLVDLADEVAYLAHDLDDAVRSGILPDRAVRELELGRRAEHLAGERHGDDPPRRARVSALIELLVTDLVEATAARLARERVRSTADVRAFGGRLVGFSGDVARAAAELKERLFESVYRHWRVMRMWRKAKRFVTALFTAHVEAPDTLPPEWRRWADECGLERAVCDYVAGMTDRFAQQEFERLFHPFEKP